MASEPEGNELIDVVVRLPRKAIEDTLLQIPVSPKVAFERRLGEAKALLTAHRRRGECFRGVRFSDPSWDIILELYVAAREDRPLAVSQLCELSGGSTTTALRHIENMEALGYIARGPDPDDRRRSLVSILPLLVTALEAWLDLQLAACQIGF